MIKLTGRATGNHNTGLYIKHLFKTYIHAIILHFARRRGGGGRWSSLHESTSVCPPLLISSQPHAQTLPLTYSALSLCSLHFPNTHTHKHEITILHYPSSQAQEHYIFFCTLHTSSTRSLSSWTRHCQNHCTLYNRVRPFPVSGNTLCEYVLPMCMYMCFMYVC